MKKWIKRILVLFVLVIVIGAAGAYSLVRRSNSLIDGMVVVEGIVQPWADVQYHPMWMEEEDILANAEGRLVLQPQAASGSAE